MKLEQQVCSLELVKRLKELGVKQESFFVWMVENPPKRTDEPPKYIVKRADDWRLENMFDWVSAFTVAELGEMLPKVENLVFMLFENGHCQITIQAEPLVSRGEVSKEFPHGRENYCPRCYFEDDEVILRRECSHNKPNRNNVFEAPTEADARARMLIYLLENKLLTLP